MKIFVYIARTLHLMNHCKSFKDLQTLSSSFFLFIIVPFFSSILQLILLQRGDVEANTGHRKIQLNCFSSCHWNVNSFISHKMAKLPQIEAYNSIYKYDMIYISKKYFDTSISVDDKKNQLDGYNLSRADHSNNTKRQKGCCLVLHLSLGTSCHFYK